MNTTREAAWLAMLDRLVAFVGSHGRMPQISENDGQAPKLGPWYFGQLRGRHQSEERVALLNQHVPGWRDTGQDIAWKKKLDRLEAFVGQHDRLPLHSESDGQSGNLSYWLTNQRVNEHLTPERLRALNDAVPTWRDGSRVFGALDVAFEGVLSRAEVWVRKTGSRPTAHMTDGDPGTNLGKWLSRLRSGIGLTADREALLDRRLPGWRGITFDDTLERFKAFVVDHGRVPSAKETDEKPGPHLGSWLSTQRKNQDLSPERSAKLEAVFPNWRMRSATHL